MSSVEPSPTSGPPQFAPPPPQQWVAPEPKRGPAPGWRFAGFWVRFIAYLIDAVIITIPLLVLALLIGGTARTATAAGDADTTRALGLVVLLAILLLVFGYFPFWWARGATPGMMPFRMRVVRTEDGSRIGIGRAILRYLGFLVAGSFMYIGLIWAAFDERKQGWHDKIADTYVIRPE